MQAKEIFDILKKEFGESILELTELPLSDSFIVISPEKAFDIFRFLRDDSRTEFDYFMCLSGVDCGENLGLVYHLNSMKLLHKITVKLFVPKSDPVVDSAERIWRSADWHEREAYDMFGVRFEGHHNLIRILCPYDWEGFPLRKDYVAPEVFHGMPVAYGRKSEV